MATLTADQLAEFRRDVESETTPPYVKAVLNAAVQAVEDYFENTARAGISTAINSATQPLGVTLTAGQKTLVAKWWLKNKFGRGG